MVMYNHGNELLGHALKFYLIKNKFVIRGQFCNYGKSTSIIHNLKIHQVIGSLVYISD